MYVCVVYFVYVCKIKRLSKQRSTMNMMDVRWIMTRDKSGEALIYTEPTHGGEKKEDLTLASEYYGRRPESRRATVTAAFSTR